MMLNIATAPHRNSKRWKQDTTTWDELPALLGLHDPADRRECGNYVLGTLDGPHRNKSTITGRCALSLDADYADAELPERVKALGVAALMHTTWRHDPEKNPRYRLLLLLERSVTPEEYERLARAVMHRLGWDQFDHSGDQPERFMYKPSTQDPDTYERYIFAGDPLAVDDLLAEVPSEDSEPPAAAPVEPEAYTGTPAAVDRAVEEALVLLEKLADLPKDRTMLIFGEERGWQENSGFFTLACRLVRAANCGTGYTLEQAREDFVQACPANTEGVKPDHEWQNAVRKVGGDVLDPAKVPSTAPDDFDPEDTTPADADHEATRKRFPRLDIAALLDPNRPPREWVVDGLLPAGASAALIAPAGVGKSLLLMAIALAVAQGRTDFAGLRIPRARRVLLVDKENTEDDYVERLRALGITPADVADLHRLVLIHLPRHMSPLDTAEGGADLEAIVEAYGIERGDLVILDSFQRVVEGPENDADTARAYYRHTAEMLKRLGLTVVRTDNTGKDPKKGGRGTSSKRDDVDLELLLEREASNRLRIRDDGKVRMTGARLPLTLDSHIDDDGLLTYSASNPERELVLAARRVLDDQGLPLDIGQDKAWETVKKADEGIPRRVLRSALEERRQAAADFPKGEL